MVYFIGIREKSKNILDENKDCQGCQKIVEYYLLLYSIRAHLSCLLQKLQHPPK